MSLYSFLTNNILINNLLIITGLDAKKELSVGQWKAFNYNSEKSIQENAGFSHNLEVEESLKIVKSKLQLCLYKYTTKRAKILDLGCGPGIYMQMLSDNYVVGGVDVSEKMLLAASSLLPQNKFYLGNFLSIHFDTNNYQAIYSISVLEYIPVSKIDVFFQKCASILSNNGLLFIQYPHALSFVDLYYPDRNYINYSPAFITKIASKYFNVIENKHSYDERQICNYDTSPYPTNTKTFKNGCLLIATKK